MPRSRRFLALCAFVAALAWTNVQAMACCWSGSATAATMAGSTGDADPAETAASQHAEASTAAAAPASCHGPAATPEPTGSAESAHPDESAVPHNEARASSHENAAACGDAFTSAATTPSCCETSAPAETFSAVPRFEALPAHAFYADAPAPRISFHHTDKAHFQSPAPPRFLALERLLI